MAKSTGSPLAAGATLEVTSSSGGIVVTGEARKDVLVENGSVTSEGGRLRVERSSGGISVRCPAGTDVIAGTSSGSMTLRGELGIARVATSSGNIEVEQVATLDARTGSGDIKVQTCAGDCRGRSGSGDLRVGSAGSVDLSTGSGDVEANAVGGAVIRTGSGDVTVGIAQPGDVKIDDHSGSITVTVPRGARPAARLRSNGDVRCEPELGDDFNLEVNAGSGNITVTEK
ncbi:MAG: DUF4097 family beta strand repeat-containing protein [Acidimicrobiia bacterium]